MNQLLSKQQQTAIIKELSLAADDVVWSKSKFLNVMGKKITLLRDEFKNLTNPIAPGFVEETKQTVAGSKVVMTTVYVSLYCANGATTNNWLPILAALPTQLVSRPIYLEESQVVEFLRSRPNKDNEAYIAVEIPSDSMVQLVHDKIPLDKLGQQLATIKGQPLNKYFTGTLTLVTGKYKYSDCKLTKISLDHN